MYKRQVIPKDESVTNAKGPPDHRKRFAWPLEVATFVAAVAAAIGSIWQGAGTARSVNAQVESSRLQQRAWLTVKSVTLARPLAVGDRPSAVLEIINSGQTPAREAVIGGNLFGRSGVTEKEIVESLTVGAPDSRMVIAPGVQVLIPVEADEAVRSTGQIDAVLKKALRLYVHGRIIYKDVYDQTHETRYCFRFDPQTPTGVGHFAACGFHNDAN